MFYLLNHISGIPISKNENDHIFVYTSLVDKNKTIFPVNGYDITFTLEGEGKIIDTQKVAIEAGISTILIYTLTHR